MRKLALLLTVLCAALGIGLYAAGSSGLLPSLWGSPDPSPAAEDAAAAPTIDYWFIQSEEGVLAGTESGGSYSEWVAKQTQAKPVQVKLATNDGGIQFTGDRDYDRKDGIDDGHNQHWTSGYGRIRNHFILKPGTYTFSSLNNACPLTAISMYADGNGNAAKIGEIEVPDGIGHTLVNLTASNGVCEFTVTDNDIILWEFTATVTNTDNAAAQTELAFEPTTLDANGNPAEGTKWYALCIRYGQQVYANNSTDVVTTDANSDVAFDDSKKLWCVVGNSDGSYSIVNRAYPGRKLAFNHPSDRMSLQPNTLPSAFSNLSISPSDWLYPNVAYVIEVNNVGNSKINIQGNALKFWSGVDQGSSLYFIEAPQDASLPEVPEQFTEGLPFKTTTITDEGEFAPDTRWYTMRIRGNKYIRNNGSADHISLSEAGNSAIVPMPSSLWCFVGDAENGVTIYNMASGASKQLSSPVPATGTTMVTVNAPAENRENVWEVLPSEGNYAGRHYLKLKSEANAFVNDVNGSLSFWKSSWAPADHGSAIDFDWIEGAVVPPFQTTTITADGAFAPDTHWYRMQIRPNDATPEGRAISSKEHDSGNLEAHSALNTSNDHEVMWCFVEADGGYHLYNYAKGSSQALTRNDNHEVAFSSNPTVWVLSKFNGTLANSQTDGWLFNAKGTNSYFHNHGGGNPGNVRGWNGADAARDAGSAIRFVEADPLPFESTTIADGEFAADTKWYWITVEDRYLTNVPGTTQNYDGFNLAETKADPVVNGEAWCLVATGDGYKIFNRAEGPSKALSTKQSNNAAIKEFVAADSADDLVKWSVEKHSTYSAPGYYLVKNNAGGYMQNFGHQNDLGVWWQAQDHSRVKFIEIPANQLPDASDEGPETVEMTFTNRKQGSPNSGNASDWTSYTDANAPANTYDEAGKHPYELIFTSDVNETGRGINQYTRNDDGTGSGGDTNPKHIRHAFRHCTITLSTSAEGYYVKSAVMKLHPGDNSKTITVTADGQNHSLSGSQFNELTFNGTPDQPIALTFGNQDWAVLYSCTVELAKKGSAAKPTSIIIDDANVEGYAWSEGDNTESAGFRNWTATVNTVPVTIKYTAAAGAGGNQKFGAMDSDDGKKGFVICGEYTLELPEQYKIKSAKYTFKRVADGTPTLQFPLDVERKGANEDVQEGTQSTHRAYKSTGSSDDDTWAKFTWDTPVNSFSFNTENSKKRILVKSIELIFADESGTEPDPGIVENVYNMEFYSRAQGSPASGGANSWTSNVDTEHPVAISLSSSASDGINQYTRKDDGTQGDGAVGRIAIKNTTITLGTPAMGGYVRSLTMRVRGGEGAATAITVNGTRFELAQGQFYTVNATGTASQPITITADNADWTVIYGMNVEVVVPTQAVPDEPVGDFISPWVSIHIRKGQGNVINGVASGVTTIGRSTNGNNPATNYTPQAYSEEWKIAGNAAEGFKLVNRQFPTLVLATRNDNNYEQIVELKADGQDANYIYRWDIEPSGDGSYFAINPHGNGKYLNSRGTAGQQLKFWSLDDGGKLRFLTADGVWEPFIAESYRETLKDYLDDIACFGTIADIPGEYANLADAIEAGKAAVDAAEESKDAIDAAARPFFEMIADQPFTLENVSVAGLFLSADEGRNRLHRGDGSEYTSVFTLKIDPKTMGRYNLFNPLSGKTVKACQADNNPWYLEADYPDASFKLHTTGAGYVGLQQPVGGNASFIHWGASLGGITRWVFADSPGSQWILASAPLGADAVEAFEYVREIEDAMVNQPWSAFMLDDLRNAILNAIENGNTGNIGDIYRSGIAAVEANIASKAAGEKVNIRYENNGQWLTTANSVPATTATEHIGDDVTPGTVWTLEPAGDNKFLLVNGNGDYIVTLPTTARAAAEATADAAAATPFGIKLVGGKVVLDPLTDNDVWFIRLNQGALVTPVSSFHNMEGQTPRLYYIRNVDKMNKANAAERRSYLTASGATTGSDLQLWLEPQGSSFWVVQADVNDRYKIYNAYWHETHIGAVNKATTDEADGYYYITRNHFAEPSKNNAGLYISQQATTAEAGSYCLDRGGFRANYLEHTYTCDLLSGGYSPRGNDIYGTAWVFVPVTEKMELDFIRRSEQDRSSKAREMVEYFMDANPWCREAFEKAHQHFNVYSSAPGYTPQNARKFTEGYTTLAADFNEAVLDELPGKQFELFSRSHIDAGPAVKSTRIGVTDDGKTLGIIDREKRDCDAFTFVPSNEAGWFYIVNGEGKFLGANGQTVSSENSAAKFTLELRWTLTNGTPSDYWTCIRLKNGSYASVAVPQGRYEGGNYVVDPALMKTSSNNNNVATGFEFFPWTPDVTGIETVDPDELGSGFQGMYNLQGVRVNPEGAAPGIYIVRTAGKVMKVIIR